MSIEVNNEATDTSLPDTLEHDLSELGRDVLDAMHVNSQAEVSIVLVDVPAMTTLHVKWMDEPGPTDVLSFPMDQLRPGTADEPTPPGLLGDIVLCPEVAARQAVTAGHSTEQELFLLTVHGMLHLLGFDHAEPEEKAEMFGIQDRLLAAFLAKRDARA